MPTVSYPYDDSGTAASNRVTNESQVLTVLNRDPFRYFIPTHAPFYRTNFQLIARDALGNPVPLVEGTDYNFSMKYIGATRANGQVVYGGVSIINQIVQGPISVSYQCLGGRYSADRDFVIQTIAENNYNPRRVAWDQVTSIQEYFPPSQHPQDLDNFTGFRDLISAFDRLTTAVGTADPLRNTMYAHILNYHDPHQTLPQVVIPPGSGGGSGTGGRSDAEVFYLEHL